MATVLITDDDRAIRDSLHRALSLEGYQVVTASNGSEALGAVREHSPDVVVLDVSMPHIDGLTVCRVLRAERSDVPILLLTARTSTADRVTGLDAGADDYVVKPFELDELLARLRALLRRGTTTNGEAGDPGEVMTVGDLRLDSGARRVWRAEREIELSKTEFDLLALLMSNVGLVLSHSTIYDRIWGYDFGPESKNLAVYISYLRRKVETDDEPKLIHTVRGVGYTLRPGRAE